MINKVKNTGYTWLRWSERYTKTDMIYLAKGGFWLVLSQMIGSLSGLVLTIAFANLIPTDSYGTYRYILSIIGILAVTTFPGINMAATNSVARNDESTFWKLVKTKGRWSILSTIISALGVIYYHWQGNNTLALALTVAMIAIPITYTLGMYAVLLNGRKDFRGLAFTTSLIRVITTLVIIWGLLVTTNPIILVALYFIPEIVLKAIFLFRLYRQRDLQPSSIHSLQRLTGFGFHLSVMEVLKTIASQVDSILVFHYLGAGSLAAYAIATTAPGQIKSILQHTTTLALPKLSSTEPGTIAKSLPAKLWRLEFTIILAVAAYCLIAPFLFPIFFPKYQSVILISQIYSLSLLFFPRTFLSTAMLAHLKQKELYIIRIVAPAVRIIIFLVALPLWGLWGATIGSIVNNAATAFIYQRYFKKAFPSDIAVSK